MSSWQLIHLEVREMWDFRNDEENEKREIWDERLVLGDGWLYRQDIRLSNLTIEQSVIGKYLDIVDELLFGR